MPDMNDIRNQLFSEQKALLEALMVGDSASLSQSAPGFDLDRVEDAAKALKRKRKRTMLRACPQLLQIFPDSDSLSRAMDCYFSECPSSPAAGPSAGPYADSLAFIIFLEAHPRDHRLNDRDNRQVQHQIHHPTNLPAALVKQARKQQQKSWFTMMGSKFDFRLWC